MKPLDEDFNRAPTPKSNEACGRTFAPADIKIIKQGLHFLIQEAYPLSESEISQITNLLHRLDRIA